jgi:hypothetical protein
MAMTGEITLREGTADRRPQGEVACRASRRIESADPGRHAKDLAEIRTT